MSTAQDRGWGNPDAPDFRATKIVKLEVAGITLYVHRGISYLAEQFILELVKTGYNVSKRRDDWAYANRNIFINGRDTGRKSNHAWGLALDINAVTNPVSYDGRVHTDLPKNISSIAAKYGFFWGGNYSATGYRDPMHFEFLDRPRDAVALTARIRESKRTPVIPTPQEPHTSRFRRVYARGGDSYRDLARRYGPGRRLRDPARLRKQAQLLRTINHNKELTTGTKVRIPRAWF